MISMQKEIKRIRSKSKKRSNRQISFFITPPIIFLNFLQDKMSETEIKKENKIEKTEEIVNTERKNSISKLELKLDMNRLDKNTEKLEGTSNSARPRIKTPRNPLNNVLLSPRKEQFTSPREEISKFISKRKDLNLEKDKVFIDETEDEMLLQIKNQDVKSPKINQPEKRRSYHKEGEKTSHFHQL